MKKRLWVFIMASIMILGLSACGSQTRGGDTDQTEERQDQFEDEETDEDTDEEIDEDTDEETDEDTDEETGPKKLLLWNNVDLNLEDTPVLFEMLQFLTEGTVAVGDSFWDRLGLGDEEAVQYLLRMGNALSFEHLSGELYSLADNVTEPEQLTWDYVYGKDTLRELLFFMTSQKADLDWLEGALTLRVFGEDSADYTYYCDGWQTEPVGPNTWEIIVDGYPGSLEAGDIGQYKSIQITYTVVKDSESLLDGYRIADAEVKQCIPSGWAWDYIRYIDGFVNGSNTEFWDRIEMESYSMNLNYELIYLDDDDIPELVIGLEGYNSVFLYTWQDGIREVFANWGYNHGYDYLPRTGIVCNASADYAGLEVSQSYYKMSENGLDNLFRYRRELYIDRNGNGMPDDEDEYIDDEDSGRIFIYDETRGEEVEISQQELNKMLRRLGIPENESGESLDWGQNKLNFSQIWEKLYPLIEYQYR